MAYSIEDRNPNYYSGEGEEGEFARAFPKTHNVLNFFSTKIMRGQTTTLLPRDVKYSQGEENLFDPKTGNFAIYEALSAKVANTQKANKIDVLTLPPEDRKKYWNETSQSWEVANWQWIDDPDQGFEILVDGDAEEKSITLTIQCIVGRERPKTVLGIERNKGATVIGEWQNREPLTDGEVAEIITEAMASKARYGHTENMIERVNDIYHSLTSERKLNPLAPEEKNRANLDTDRVVSIRGM